MGELEDLQQQLGKSPKGKKKSATPMTFNVKTEHSTAMAILITDKHAVEEIEPDGFNQKQKSAGFNPFASNLSKIGS